MLIGQIREGDLVVSKCWMTEGAFGVDIPSGTPGIVTKISNYDDVYVEFEMYRTLVSRPLLCHPIHLQQL